MALTEIAGVRLNISDKARIKREAWTADGVTDEIQLALSPVQISPVPRVWQEDVPLIETTDYTVDYDNGIITFVVVPPVNYKLVIEYYATVFTDDEITHFLSIATGDKWLASAYLLLAMAVDAARIARRETLGSRSGVFGQATIDTSVRSKELREQAKAFIDLYNTYGAGLNVAAEGITQVIWTDAMGERWVAQELLATVGF